MHRVAGESGPGGRSGRYWVGLPAIPKETSDEIRSHFRMSDDPVAVVEAYCRRLLGDC